jgi:glycosidase
MRFSDDHDEKRAIVRFGERGALAASAIGRQISERRVIYPKFYKQLIALRKAHSALQQGETEWLHNSAVDSVLTYIRHGYGEEFLIAVNTSNQPFTGVIDAPTGDYKDVTPGVDARKISLPAVSLGAFEFRIYEKTR